MEKERKKGNLISASEIGQYGYCSISWYLHRKGCKPKSVSLEKGKKEHRRLGEVIEKSEKSYTYSRLLAVIGYILFLIGGLGFILGLIL